MASPRVLFLAATELEMEPLRRRLRQVSRRIAPRCVITGIGKASAAARTALELGATRPGLAVFLGCAGAYPGSGLAIGDLVVASGETLADEGVETASGFLDLERLGFPSVRVSSRSHFNEIPLGRPGRLALATLAARLSGTCAIRVGRLATVSTCSGTSALARKLARRTGALAESMEGAGAAIAALLLGIRLIEVRGISNIAGRRDRRTWDIATACERSAEAAVHLAAHELGGSR